MPSVSNAPTTGFPQVSNVTEVARLKVVLNANLPPGLGNQTIPCNIVFGPQGCTIKPGEPLTLSFMISEEFSECISASLESCVTYVETPQARETNVAPVSTGTRGRAKVA
ncbi:hypothetical protein BDY19DRAFT_1052047 [Irpex rosettiformis]|uniref:Uncharacterized protein n=1 Tax=Irpex rosettiformis TaxID=378272 RepID=A0ACB8UKA2_9APHY|nr:hypothetical protein BDY19DRAFT_1052047 [Irpex rosettiformis]